MAGELRARLQLTERAESTLREDLERERERAERLEEELRQARRGFWTDVATNSGAYSEIWSGGKNDRGLGRNAHQNTFRVAFKGGTSS